MVPHPLASRVLFTAAFCVLLLAVVLAARPVAAQAPPLDQLLSTCRTSPSNPYVITTQFPKGRSGLDEAAILAFRDSPNNTGHIPLATARQVGAVYGLAYDEQRETLYASAFHKRGVPFGPGGPGAIYALDLRSGNTRQWVTVPSAGRDSHNPTDDYFPDLSARGGAGTNSLGDIDISDDGSELAVMNLPSKRIYRYSLPDGELLGDFPFGAAPAAWQADAWPFGIGYNNGKLYHGVVRIAFASQDPDQLWAFVYESNPDGSGMREVASTHLRYARGMLWPGEGQAIWNPWREPAGTIVPNRGRYPMPILADIEFAPDGSKMILGFRDRFGDVTFYTTPPNQPPPGEYFYNTPGGDIVPAWPAGDAWRFQVSPEFFSGDFGPNASGSHDETSFGGLAVLPDGDTVVMSANSPVRINSAGAVWLSISAGSDKAREQIYVFGQGDNFGKANGLGDVEVLCPPQEQETPTPPPSETPEDTATPTVETPTVPADTATPTDTAVPTITLTPTLGPSPTVTFTPLPPTPTETDLPTSTTVPGGPSATPRPPKTPRPDTPAPPGSTPVVPEKLPSTGGGWIAHLPLWLLAAGALALLAGLYLSRRRQMA